MRIELSSCSTVELGRDCVFRIVGQPGATLVGVRGRLWVTIDGQASDLVLEAGDSITLGTGHAALVTALKPGALRIVEPSRGVGRATPAEPARWYEALTTRWASWFSEEASRRHAEKQWGAV